MADDLRDKITAAYEDDPINRLKLPDCRVQDQRAKRATPGRFGLMSVVYCANCGKPSQLITEAWAESVFYLCNDPECLKYGQLLGATQVPDEVVEGKRHDPVAESVRELLK